MFESERGEQGLITTERATRVTSQQSVQPIRNHLNRGLYTANIYKPHHGVCQATLFPFQGLELIKLT